MKRVGGRGGFDLFSRGSHSAPFLVLGILPMQVYKIYFYFFNRRVMCWIYRHIPADIQLAFESASALVWLRFGTASAHARVSFGWASGALRLGFDFQPNSTRTVPEEQPKRSRTCPHPESSIARRAADNYHNSSRATDLVGW
ncbi:hypothetical protein D3C81_1596150 [compost metagenome]